MPLFDVALDMELLTRMESASHLLLLLYPQFVALQLMLVCTDAWGS